MEHSQQIFLYVFQHVMLQLKGKSDDSYATPITSSLTERTSYYSPDFSIDTAVPLDRALMYSEAARLATFENWPHMEYQWVFMLPSLTFRSAWTSEYSLQHVQDL